ncbi:hypothetical protein SV7mr_46830 [Stieleria bergensis]|uniref:3-keto-alpha-glucoside-1,2-lyase/3-keto-2-hydroxy-glucal hydratase domain-containing protein n=1 Tax=Stieleria bergensis TaxID=2528025 RepID=A0A517T188_9BACT|nr:hypothetical protein SV7mr_46830 [Planctomycetes bacterium SV_7m_r]
MIRSLLTCVASVALLACSSTALLAEEKPVPLFNGKDLTGWEGRADLWSVEDGQIVGRTTKENPLKKNSFLIYTAQEPSDFELTLQYKIENTNSGIQYRSKVIDKKEFVVGGYQADIDFTNRFAGILYEERGRGILAQRGQSVTLKEDGKKSVKKFGDGTEIGNGIHPGQWNDYRIVAKGNHLQHFINGKMTAEVFDEQADKAATSGVIAFQLHVGAPMVVRFKNIVLHSAK